MKFSKKSFFLSFKEKKCVIIGKKLLYKKVQYRRKKRKKKKEKNALTFTYIMGKKIIGIFTTTRKRQIHTHKFTTHNK